MAKQQQRQFPTPEGSPTGDADSPVAVTLTPPSEGPSLREHMNEQMKNAPVIPAPTVEPNVRHVPGQRPIMEILDELFREIDNHPDAKLIHVAKGKPPRVSPGGDPQTSEGFPETPMYAQHTLELRLAYRDTVTLARQQLVAEPMKSPFEQKWGGLIAEQAQADAQQQAQRVRLRQHEQAIKDGTIPAGTPLPNQPAPAAERPFAYAHLIPQRQEQPAPSGG